MSPGTRSRSSRRRRVPDFFIVGHAKCGTSALHDALELHPQIWLPAVKEPRYLATDMRRRFTPPRSGRLPETIEDYLALSRPLPPTRSSGSLAVLCRLAHGRAADRRTRPRAKAIVIFREPAGFLRSLHLQLIQSHVESEHDLRTALSLERNGRTAGDPAPLAPPAVAAVLRARALRAAAAAAARTHSAGPSYSSWSTTTCAPTTAERCAGAGVRRRRPAPQPAGPAETNPTLLIRSQGLDEAAQCVRAGRGTSARRAAGRKAVLPAGVRRRRSRQRELA